MGIVCEVRRFDADIKAAYERLFPDSDTKSDATLDWRFADNAHGRAYFALALSEEGQIAGMIGLIPTIFVVEGREVLGLQAVDTIVDPAFRGKALFVRMGKAIYDHQQVHQADFVWGFPNDQAARGWFGRLGWTHMGMVPFLVKPLRTGYVLRRISASLGKIDLPLALPGKKAPPPNTRQITEVGPEADAMLDAFHRESGATLRRDAAWLNWRLFAHPTAQYRTVASFDDHGAMRALVSTIVLEKHGARICYVMEAMAATKDAAILRKLMGSELAFARRHGAEVALAWCSSTSQLRSTYARAGFLPLPEKLRPIEMHVGGKVMAENVPSRLTNEDPHFHLSYLNSDTV